MFLKILKNSKENVCVGVSFLIKFNCSFIKEETLTQVFFSEFCEIFKNTYFLEHLGTAASDYKHKKQKQKNLKICKIYKLPISFKSSTFVCVLK